MLSHAGSPFILLLFCVELSSRPANRRKITWTKVAMRGAEGMSGRLAGVAHTHALVSLHRHIDAITVPTKLVGSSGHWQ